MFKRSAYLFALIFCLVGCKTISTTSKRSQNAPDQETTASYGYIPLDGLGVEETLISKSCELWRPYTTSKNPLSSPREFTGDKAGINPYLPLLKSLPDISIRFAVASFDASGGLTFGPAKVTAKHQNYRAVLDYVNVDVIPISILVGAVEENGVRKLTEARSSKKPIELFEVHIVDNIEEYFKENPDHLKRFDLVSLPVYVGIGLRVTADIRALEAGIPLFSLGLIGLEAQANNLAGTLTLQTLGVTGETVAASLPLPSKLDQTTIENSILAIGTNRAAIYKSGNDNNGSLTTTPRVVGIYSSIGSEPALISAIYAELSYKRPKWARPCRPPTDFN